MATSAYEIPITTLSGERLDPALLRGRATLVVNVASKCGMTVQYEGLQALYDRYRDRGLMVVGAPCDQFAGQEPGTAEDIAEFCSTSYSVTFPLTEKLDVNGDHRHPLYEALTEQADSVGASGDVEWNFEKFLVSPRGEVVARFRPTTQPDAEELVAAVEAALPGSDTPAWVTRKASELQPGDHVRLEKGGELTVSEVRSPFLGGDGYVCLIEDTPDRWRAQPLPVDADVDVLS